MIERKLNAWVAIAEIISAVAVVISLIYVGFEIRSSTRESEADIQAELLTYTARRRYLVVQSSDLSSLLARGYADPTQLSPDEMLRFQSYIELLYVAWERAYMTRAAGVLSDELFDDGTTGLFQLLNMPRLSCGPWCATHKLGFLILFNTLINHWAT